VALRRRERRTTRWEEDNRLVFNPWPIVALAAFVGLLAGLALLLALL
jgi:ElaB/YqjD/DUF883 family membrane-anchored ribosome-binding protein